MIRSAEINILGTKYLFMVQGFDEDRKAAEECGMDGLRSKPILIDEVLQTLKNIFNQ